MDHIPKGLRLELLGGTEVVVGRFRNHHFPRHSHEGLMLSMIDSGIQCLHYRGAVFRGGKGQIIAIAPEEVHAGEPQDAEGWQYRTVTIPTSALETYAPSAVPTHFLCDTVLENRGLYQPLAWFFATFGYAPLLEQETALTAVIARFSEGHLQVTPPRVLKASEARAVGMARDYLAAHLEQNVSLARLERVTQMDRYQLVRAFSRRLGLPPHAWHLQRRLRKAQDLLIQGEPLAQTAFITGFADQSHFTRAFKRLTGVPPGRYRRDHLRLRGHIVETA